MAATATAPKIELKPHELRNQRAKLFDQAREIGERATTEKREFTPDERTNMDGLLAKMDEFAKDISRLERLEAHSALKTEEEFRSAVDRISQPLPHEVTTKYEYSFRRAILGAADGKLDGLEKECNDEICLRIGKKSAGQMGFFSPTRMRMKWQTHRNYRVGGRLLRPSYDVERRIDDTSAGAGAVLTRWDTTWIEFLRAKMVLDQLGITVMNDMHGNFQMPSQTGIGTVSWVAESTSVSSTAQTIGQVLFQPKTVGAYTDMSRRFLEQLSIDPELFVRNDLANILSRGIESAVYNGTGSPQPVGILQNSGITNIVSLGTNGGSPTWSSIVQLQELLEKGNVSESGNYAYLTTPAGKGTLKQTPVQGLSQTSYYPKFLWENDELNDLPAYSTNLVPSNLTKSSGSSLSAIILANWMDAVLAFWTGMDVLVDPYTGGPAGTLRIVVLQDCDFEVRHPASFAYSNDMVTV